MRIDPSVTLAVFHVVRPEPGDTTAKPDAWTKFETFYSKSKLQSHPSSLQSGCELAIQLPGNLPTLCQFVDSALQLHLQYKVELFGPALLTFDSLGKQMEKIQIRLPGDNKVLYDAIHESLSVNGIAFRDSRRVELRKGLESIPEKVLEFLFEFPSIAVLVVAIKYMSPVIVEIAKTATAPIKIELGDAKIEIPLLATLDRVDDLLSRLSEHHRDSTSS